MLLLTDEKLQTKTVSIKPEVTFKTKQRSFGRDKTPHKLKRKSTGRMSTNHSEKKVELTESTVNKEIIMHKNPVTQTKRIRREKSNLYRRSTFDITERGLLTPEICNFTCIKSSTVITKKEETGDSKRKNRMFRRSSDKEVTKRVSRDSATNRRSTFNISNKEVPNTKENSVCETPTVCPSIKGMTAEKGRSSLYKRSGIPDKQVLPGTYVKYIIVMSFGLL